MTSMSRWIGCVAWLLAAAPASAGVVRGVVRLPATAPAPVASVHYPGQVASLPATSGAGGGVIDAVISIDRLPAAATAPAAAGVPTLAQRGQVFEPRVLAVVAGSTVTFPNFDPVFHNVFSVSPARRFDLGKYPRGQSRQVRFDRPGVVQVYCDIHANMAAWIVVQPHAGFARPDATGAFTLPALPPGEYVLEVWHPDVPVFRHRIVMPERGDLRVELDPQGSRARVVAATDEEGR